MNIHSSDPFEPYPLPVDRPGFYVMTAEEYHADPCPEPSLSSSIAWLLLNDSAARARHCHQRLNPTHVEEQSESFDIGTIAHRIILEGHANAVKVIEGVTDWRTKQAQELRDQVRAQGHVPVLRKHWDQIVAMTQATRAQLDAHEDGRAMFRDGVAEVVAVWQDTGAGLPTWCRARLDYLRADGIDDYKSTRGSAHPEQVAKNLPDNGWLVQAAFYRRGVAALTGQELPVRFAVQECYEPYLLSVNAPGPALEFLAEHELVPRAIERWARCLDANVWPGYGTQTAFAEMTPWVEQRWMGEAVRDAV